MRSSRKSRGNLAIFFLCLMAACPRARAADDSQSPVSATKAPSPGSDSGQDDGIYQQVLSISAGPFQPRSAVVSNGSSSFDYGGGPSDSFMVQAGWAARVLSLGGELYISENIDYSRFSGSVSGVLAPDTTLSVNLLGLDTRAIFALERLPLRWFIPFVEGGYQYTLYSQAGSSDLDSAEGGVGNAVMGAGARFWLNRALSVDSELKGTYDAVPIFLTVKWNRVFPNGAPLDLADSSVLAGLGIGL